MKKCLFCGSDFEAKRKDARYCTNSCSCRAYYRNNLETEMPRKRANYYKEKAENYQRLRANNSRATTKYKASNREKIRESNREYQVRTKNSLRYWYDKYFGGNRDRILEIYNNQCAICGLSPSGLSVHHIDGSGRADNPNNEISNLILLCRSCHMRHHRLGDLTDEGIVRTYVKA